MDEQQRREQQAVRIDRAVPRQRERAQRGEAAGNSRAPGGQPLVPQPERHARNTGGPHRQRGTGGRAQHQPVEGRVGDPGPLPRQVHRLDEVLRREHRERPRRRAHACAADSGRGVGETVRKGRAEERRARRLEQQHETRGAQRDPGELGHHTAGSLPLRDRTGLTRYYTGRRARGKDADGAAARPRGGARRPGPACQRRPSCR